MLSDCLIGVYGVYFINEEIRIFVLVGLMFVYCLMSNVKFEGMMINFLEVFCVGVNVVIGNDFLNFVGIMDMFFEMRILGFFVNFFERKVYFILVRKIFEIVIIGGVWVLGIKVGFIREGYFVDFFLIDVRKLWFKLMESFYFLFVYLIRGSDVVLIMVNGKIVWKKGGK